MKYFYLVFHNLLVKSSIRSEIGINIHIILEVQVLLDRPFTELIKQDESALVLVD